MGRESPNFIPSEPMQPLPEPNIFINSRAPLPHPDPLVALRMHMLGAAAANPMLALQSGALNGLHPTQDMYAKAQMSGLFPGHMVQTATHPVLHAGLLPGAAPALLNAGILSPPNPDTLDLRKYSIDALRHKAREHAHFDSQGSTTKEVRSKS